MMKGKEKERKKERKGVCVWGGGGFVVAMATNLVEFIKEIWCCLVTRGK
jgi:hypothetical protein